MDLIVLNRQDFTLEEMRAEEVLSSIADSLKPVFEEKNISFSLKACPAYILVEYDLFKTLLLNLLDNAMKAGASRIEIAGEPTGDMYSVSVTDNGRGIPAAELNKITEAFYMVDKSRSRKQHGAGLGLSLAEKIAGIHGSTLEFNSREGIGTVVKIDLTPGRGEDGE
jgi:signal transduction histidine kinase